MTTTTTTTTTMARLWATLLPALGLWLWFGALARSGLPLPALACR